MTQECQVNCHECEISPKIKEFHGYFIFKCIHVGKCVFLWAHPGNKCNLCGIREL